MTRFPLIFADPAWRFKDRLRMSKIRRGADAQYHSTMTTADICALPVRELAEDNAVLVLWRPSAFAADALRVVDAWGFKVKTEIVWYKVRPSGKVHFGMGRITRAAGEIAYVCTRGRPPKPKLRNVRSVFIAPPLAHSVKPDVIQTTFAAMYPGPALELFARRDLPNWTCVGNECPSTFGRDLRDVLAEMVSARLAA